VLPDILAIAEKHQLKMQKRTRCRKEILFQCPFCGDKPKRYHLSLNREKKTFRCWLCGESGGVLRFISLLEGLPESEVRARYLSDDADRHPAERLTRRQWEMLARWLRPRGRRIPDREKLMKLRERNRAYVIRTLDGVWGDWLDFVDAKLEEAYFYLAVGLRYPSLLEKYAMKALRLEAEAGIPLYGRALRIAVGMEPPPPWKAEIDAFLKKYEISVSPDPVGQAGEEEEINMNHVILIGRLTRDPELRYTPAGVAVAQFTLAVDRPFSNQQGERETDFIPIVTWRQLAETCAQYLRKGRLAAVEGRLQVRSYDNAEGRKVYVTEVIAKRIQFLSPAQTASVAPSAPAPAPSGSDVVDVISDNDLPF